MDEGGSLEGNQEDKEREKHKHTPTQVVVSMLALAFKRICFLYTK